MKIIRYALQSGDSLITVRVPLSEYSLAVAEKEAVDGKYTIEDDGTEAVPTRADDTSAMLIDHEYRLTLLELGVIE